MQDEEIQDVPPTEGGGWANAEICICLVFIWYVQAWLFVHGMFLVFCNSLTKPCSGKTGQIQPLFCFAPIHLFIGFPLETHVLIDVSSTYMCTSVCVSRMVERTRTDGGRTADSGRTADGGQTADGQRRDIGRRTDGRRTAD